MGPAEAIIVYLLIWWVVLFAVLPFGIRSQAEAGEIMAGTEPSAPSRPRFLLKFAVTSVIATVLWGFVVLLIITDPLGLGKGSSLAQ